MGSTATVRQPGRLLTSTTIARAISIGLEANDFLQRSDSYSFFVALGEAIATGPTGTNVARRTDLAYRHAIVPMEIKTPGLLTPSGVRFITL